MIISININLYGQRSPIPLSASSINSCSQLTSGCAQIANANSYKTCGTEIVFQAPIDNSNCHYTDSQTKWGCYGQNPNQTWFYITITQGGNLSFIFKHSLPENGSDNYYDGIIWGPVSNGNLQNACQTTYSNPISCDYDYTSQFNTYLNISNAQVGQVYVMCLTNYANIKTKVTVNQPTGGAVSYCMIQPYSCILPTATLTGNQTVVLGDSATLNLSFTGNSPWNFTISNGGGSFQTSTNPMSVKVKPTTNTVYTVNSISNFCGTGTSSGTAAVNILSSASKIACYAFSSNVIDGMGRANGINNGAVLTSDRFGKSNRAYNFNGNGYIKLPIDSLYNSFFSYSVWVNPSSFPSLGQAQTILAIGGQLLKVENSIADGRVVWSFISSNTNSSHGRVISPPSIVLTPNKWTHLVLIRSINTIKLYVDGIFAAESNISGVPDYSNNLAFLGKNASGEYFIGKIDDIQLYKNNLSNSEISSLYNVTINNNCDVYIHTEEGLVACYDFSGDAKDGINNNHATVNNVTLTNDRFENSNSAYYFTGSVDDNIKINNADAFKNNNYTFSAWIKASSLPTLGNTAWIVGIGEGGTGDQALYLYNNSGIIGFAAHAYASPSNCLSSSLTSGNKGLTLIANHWYHVAITMGNAFYKMYVDGKLITTSTSTCNSLIYGTNTIAYIGNRLGRLSPFLGVIDDVRIYNRELSQEEVINVQFTNGCRSKCPEQKIVTLNLNYNYPYREEATYIEATNTIGSSSKVRYDGENSVILKPGFKTDTGSVFEAFNSGCGGNK